MSWFLRSSSKKKQYRSSAGRGGIKMSVGRLVFDLMCSRQIFKMMFWGVGVAALTVGVYFGRIWLSDQVAHNNYSQAIPYVVFIDAPVWRPASFDRQVQRIVATRVSPDPLKRESLAKAAELIGRSPWIEKVDGLVRCYGGRIELHATYREPAALVRARDGYHIIDRNCTRLPGVYSLEQLSELGLPTIEGVIDAAPPSEGSTWSGGDVRAGLELALLIGVQDFADQVCAIDVGNYDGRLDNSAPQIAFWTKHGMVRWGCPIGEENFGEPSPERKLYNLYSIAKRYHGAVDAGGQIVDVNHETPLIRTFNQVQYVTQR